MLDSLWFQTCLYLWFFARVCNDVLWCTSIYKAGKMEWNFRNLRNFRTLPKTKSNYSDTAQFFWFFWITVYWVPFSCALGSNLGRCSVHCIIFQVSLKQWHLGFAIESSENCFLFGAVHWEKAFEGPPWAGIWVPLAVWKEGLVGQPLLLVSLWPWASYLKNLWIPFLGR